MKEDVNHASGSLREAMCFVDSPRVKVDDCFLLDEFAAIIVSTAVSACLPAGAHSSLVFVSR